MDSPDSLTFHPYKPSLVTGPYKGFIKQNTKKNDQNTMLYKWEKYKCDKNMNKYIFWLKEF